MEKKIIGMLRPLDMQQYLFVFEGSEKIESVTTTLENFKEDVFKLTDKYNIEQVDITGPRTYSEHIVEECQKVALTQYSNSNITFTLV